MTHCLTLYIRSGCSLCEEMQRELCVEAEHRPDFSLNIVDVDSEERLIQAYGHKVPVLTTESGMEICHYFLDRQALDSYFSTH